jgi:hypothetical protein
MELKDLTRDQLNEEFIRVNTIYHDSISQKYSDFIKDPGFLKVREELRLVLNELKRRRQDL